MKKKKCPAKEIEYKPIHPRDSRKDLLNSAYCCLRRILGLVCGIAVLDNFSRDLSVMVM